MGRPELNVSPVPAPGGIPAPIQRTDRVSKEFKVGDTVKWTSSSAGSTKTKRGEIVLVVAPGSASGRKALQYIADRRATHRSAFGGGWERDHVSYLVCVPGATPKSKPILYWPRAAALKRV